MGTCHQSDQHRREGNEGRGLLRPRRCPLHLQPGPVREGLELKGNLRRHFLGRQGGERHTRKPTLW